MPLTAATDTAVQDMARYYAQRAQQYERVYHKPERQTDLRAMEAWVRDHFRGRRVLEIAAGTGWWTVHGAAEARDWLATDLNDETLAIARAKPLPAAARCARLDAYTLLPPAGDADPWAGQAGPGPFDAAFAGFWWSHVPLARLDGWLDMLHARLPSGARVAFLDNRYVPGSSTPIARTDADGNQYQQRPLDDGSVHEVVKNFPDRDGAVARLGPRACEVRWQDFAHYWVLSYALS